MYLFDILLDLTYYVNKKTYSLHNLWTDFTCLKYGKYFYTDSREKSEQLYLFAKKELITLYKKRAYSLEYSSFGNVSSYKILNENLMKEFLLKLENFKNKMENNKWWIIQFMISLSFHLRELFLLQY